jgi:sugar phosphate isomerase/epimerase
MKRRDFVFGTATAGLALPVLGRAAIAEQPLTKPGVANRRWSLDQLTINHVRPAELVEIAAAAGYDAISPFVGLGDNGGVWTVPLRAGAPDTNRMRRALSDTGVVLANVDGFVLTPTMDMSEIHDCVLLSADLGARNIVAMLFDPVVERGYDRFCQLCGYAKDARIGVAIEFMAMSGLAAPSDALRWIERVQSRDVGLQIDLLHLAYAGKTPADVAKLDRHLIRSAQVCDGPANPNFDAYAYSAVHERLAPGDGEFPVAQFMAALPPDIIVGVEVPTACRIDGKDAHIQRARSLLARARGVGLTT